VPMALSGASSLLALDPDMHLTRLFAWLDVDDARSTANGTILGVRLLLTAAQIDGKLVHLSAERTLHSCC